MLVPFWHIAPSGDTDVANMKIVQSASTVHNGISVPLMKNTKKIQAGTDVVLFDPSLQVPETTPQAKEPLAKKQRN